MSAIREDIVVDRTPEDVFTYMTDPSRLPEWQKSALSSQRVGEEGPYGVGSRIRVTRHVGQRDIPMTMEVTEFEPPRAFSLRGIDGPVRGHVHGEVAPLDDGRRSRVTLELDFEGHGVGKALVPLVVRPQARKELPDSERRLKEHLEQG
ncbi:SRPBCC family protein [Streptomyces beihaiensis]|uniref:SRPBCC family protein n=1 Tax=Streptomyces beihaiensis TaxID=2984495 RepID=A0ABT3TQ70_9ACTN|nr:SRPBCC family protein [Streptomyces beihaiensis]MCX3058890.1 SRPBCC family protein [Streptomyces beihaiensis]